MKRYYVYLIIISLFLAHNAYGFRVSRPPTLSHPLNKEQVNQLNKYLESIWNLQNGEFNLDIVTATKANAQNGDVWIILTGSIAKIQFKANNTIFTTP